MKRATALALCLFMFTIASFSEERKLAFDPALDIASASVGLCAAGLSQVALKPDRAFTIPSRETDLWGVDCGVLFPFDEGLDKVSSLAEGGALLWPALFALIGEESELLPAAAAYGEAMGYAFAAKNVLKYVVPKARPYAYSSGGLSQSLLDEAWESFPSGHTTLAFCAATSFAVLASELAPEKSLTPWLIAGGYGLAAGEAALRVFSGNHFPSDVVAGALLGSGIGFLVAELHIRRSPDAGDKDAGRLSLSPGPGLCLAISY